ncbi:SPOR domain-containing protein [Marivivens sp. JLT3646]|uniref:SPOR domain-containing protein n=1 Tax=Marivivens sp. JLT3646 TaxID=1920883 RepID=UPI0008005FCE|nr:SPOR domain-containing protein [Marivivens sp. JLT3646]APO88341.1 SPOR domain-containing protein [Marivivens sp. JLT3646]OBR36004.1 sporulation domain-containing protein [Donghicola sp. JL3646]
MSGKISWVVAGLLATTVLAGCDGNGQFQFPQLGGAASTEQASPSVQLVERDVEAPEVFQVTDNGLWDGRPSLGGVWVAHPDVVDPERVIIRNTENGKFVIGALFRREREQPGPALQVSSDTAAALGMLAGAPASLQVTALRREEAPVEAPAPISNFDETAIAGEEVQTTSLDPIANAEAAISAAEAEQVATAAPAPQAAVATSALTKPYIQIGIFSIQSNADRTAEILNGNGITTTILAQESQGRPFWRVVVGPAQSSAERSDLLLRVKGLGYSDAYAVTN